MDFISFVASSAIPPAQITAQAARIHAATLQQSKWLDGANFTRIHPDDLAFLFAEYDAAYFGGRIKKALGKTPLQFSLSSRMTSAGGKTYTTTNRKTRERRYEIGISTAILYGCFQDDHRPMTACGLACRDRLDALQRIMEHEIVHLIEQIAWAESSCSQPRFQSITGRFFGHTQHKHDLITPRERARVKFGIQAGSKVRFRFDGVERVGIVNRVSKRVTVLVEDPNGQRYTNGKFYSKYYIPVQMLQAAE
ncbi:hypothetical protein [Anatilimnocola floriformis]|uniref:hypothetical protein n=1 Tax=Anatilimnocola floriformis TaxID=2948575 RepID=UPI0020C35865|nr:hypothetical protein [Anatilimnocola floriformis]